jgi:hypothetical protein
VSGELPYRYDVEVVGLLASAAHCFQGRPDPVVRTRAVESATRVEVRAGLGIVGDRYFGKPAHRERAVTVIAAEGLYELAAELGSGPLDPLATRRNVVLRGPRPERCADSCSAWTAGRARWCWPAGGRRTRAPGWTSSWPPVRTAACAAVVGSAAPRARTAC